MALGSTTVSTLTNILKTRYPQSKVNALFYEDAAFLGTVKKDKKFGGNNTRISVGYGRSQGGGTFAEAQANAGTDDDAAFVVTRTSEYHFNTMSAEAIEASEGDSNSLIKGFDRTHKNGIISFQRSIAMQVYRNGGGARGQISATSNVATNSVTLAEPSDVVHFEINMYLQGGVTDGTSGALRSGGAKEAIAAVNRDTGALRSTSAAWNTTIGALAAGDYLFRAGDFGTRLKGLAAWIPSTAPTAGDSFFGVDRSVDTVRLAGVRFAATAGASKEEAILDCAVRLGREGTKPSHCYVNNMDRAEIIKSLSTQAVYEMSKSTEANVYYRALIIEGDKGPIKVLSDPNCPKGTFWMINQESWTFGSLKDVPHVVMDDGKMLVRQASSDGVEWRLRSFGQTYTDNPGANGRGTFA